MEITKWRNFPSLFKAEKSMFFVIPVTATQHVSGKMRLCIFNWAGGTRDTR